MTVFGHFYKIKIEYYAVFLLILSMVLFIMICLNWSLVKDGQYETLGSFIGGIVGCIISIVNALLLYATLVSQNDGIKNQRHSFAQERFEITFFNLLENQRRIIKEITICVTKLSDAGNESQIVIQGLDFFKFACKEIMSIKQILTAKHYISFLSHDDYLGLCAFDEFHNYNTEQEKDLKIKEYLEFLELKSTSKTYKITKHIYDDFQRQPVPDESLDVLSYTLFYKKWALAYEHYIRHLEQIYVFIDKSGFDLTDNTKYFSFIQNQMTNGEMIFISHYLKFDKQSKIQIDRSMLISQSMK